MVWYFITQSAHTVPSAQKITPKRSSLSKASIKLDLLEDFLKTIRLNLKTFIFSTSNWIIFIDVSLSMAIENLFMEFVDH